MKLILCFLLVASTITNYAKSSLDSLYYELDQAIASKDQYEKEKKAYLNDIKDLIQEKHKDVYYQLNLYTQLIENYQAYNFDSTLAYTKKYRELAQSTNNKSIETNANIKYIYVLAFSGRYTEAFDILNSIQYKDLSHEQKIEYFLIKEQIYSDLFTQSTSKEVTDKYYKLMKQYTDSLLVYLDKNSDAYLQIKEKQYRDKWQLDTCTQINNQRLRLARMGTREYSLITFERSLIYQMNKNPELEKKYLILSAISDIKASVKDNASLARLALLLYEDQEIEKAYFYIKTSFDDANAFNSRLRFIQISGVLPLITDAYQAISQKQNARMRKSLIVISLLSVFLIFALIAIRKQVLKYANAQQSLKEMNSALQKVNTDLRSTNEKLRDLNKAYAEASQVKEHYIGSFLAICSDYIDKLERYRIQVYKGIRDKKIDELYHQAKASKLLDDEMQEFYQNFDNIFLQIFPNFIDKFNELLKDEAKIKLPDPNKLNTELRIFALVRLGISDSSKIARLLRYSINTIYNYRVKIRNAAIVPRDEFKEHVMRIDVSDKTIE